MVNLHTPRPFNILLRYSTPTCFQTRNEIQHEKRQACSRRTWLTLLLTKLKVNPTKPSKCALYQKIVWLKHGNSVSNKTKVGHYPTKKLKHASLENTGPLTTDIFGSHQCDNNHCCNQRDNKQCENQHDDYLLGCKPGNSQSSHQHDNNQHASTHHTPKQFQIGCCLLQV